MQINTKKVSVGMPPAMYEELKKLASQNGHTIPSYIRWLLWKHLKEEDITFPVFPRKEG